MTNIRLPDPLTDPNAPGFTSVGIKNSNPKYLDELMGGKTISVESAAQQWGLSLSYTDLFKNEFSIIENTVLEAMQSGSKLEVLVPHLESYRVSGSLAGITISPNQKGTSLVITDFTPTGTPEAGDMLKLGNHSSKVYKILKVSRSANTLTLKLFPALRKATTGSETLILNNILFEVSINDPTTWTSNYSADGVYSSFNLELTENITDYGS